MQKDINTRQNEKNILDLQYAARIFCNRAEKANYFIWFLCIAATIISLFADNAKQIIMLISIVIEVLALSMQNYMDQNAKRFSECRRLFDKYVLFNEREEISDKLSESIRKAKNRKDYQEQITHNGNDATPGVKDWYTFKKEFSDGDRETIIECQRQNGFWTGKMSKWKMIITVIIGIVLFFVLWYEIQKHQLKVLPCLVGVVALVMKLIERVLVNLKYIKAFEKIEGATENTRLNGNDEQIRAVQSRIDELRSIPVFGINFVHKNLANYYTNLYDEIQKSR